MSGTRNDLPPLECVLSHTGPPPDSPLNRCAECSAKRTDSSNDRTSCSPRHSECSAPWDDCSTPPNQCSDPWNDRSDPWNDCSDPWTYRSTPPTYRSAPPTYRTVQWNDRSKSTDPTSNNIRTPSIFVAFTRHSGDNGPTAPLATHHHHGYLTTHDKPSKPIAHDSNPLTIADRPVHAPARHPDTK